MSAVLVRNRRSAPSWRRLDRRESVARETTSSILYPLAALLVAILCVSPLTVRAQEPVIDMHLHALGAGLNGPPPTHLCPGMLIPAYDPVQPWDRAFSELLKNPPCEHPLVGAETDEELRSATLAELERLNVYGVTSGSYVEQWHEVGGERILPALGFAFWPDAPSAARIRELLASGRYRVFAEVAIQYNGVSPSDPRFDPYLDAAEELDIPVGIHIGTGPPGAPSLPEMHAYRARLHSALELEEALIRHPRLRIYVMHAGWPMLDDMLALMWAYPRVHVDTGGICFALPRAGFHSYFRRIVQAGFGKRILFGSDQMNWPGAIETCIDAIESADFLTAEQKRDILYDNAARFLRLSEKEIARHHAQ